MSFRAKPITIVVPVEQGGVPGRALLDSLDRQEYPDLEIIVEERGNLAEKLNRGFARASGQTLGYLTPADALLPRALHRIACEVDAKRGRHVVMGRSLLLVEDFDAGVEHPREYLGRFEHLAVWKRGFDGVPRASVFFDRAVLDRCGPFRDGPSFAIHYDFICRVGKRHAIHPVDDVWSASRLAPDSATEDLSDADRLAMLVSVSRRNWGPSWTLLRWRCESSYWFHRLELHDRARHHARLGEYAAARGQGLKALLQFAKVCAMSPAMARGRWKGMRPRTPKA